MHDLSLALEDGRDVLALAGTPQVIRVLELVTTHGRCARLEGPEEQAVAHRRQPQAARAQQLKQAGEAAAREGEGDNARWVRRSLGQRH